MVVDMVRRVVVSSLERSVELWTVVVLLSQLVVGAQLLPFVVVVLVVVFVAAQPRESQSRL